MEFAEGIDKKMALHYYVCPSLLRAKEAGEEAKP